MHLPLQMVLRLLRVAGLSFVHEPRNQAIIPSDANRMHLVTLPKSVEKQHHEGAAVILLSDIPLPPPMGPHQPTSASLRRRALPIQMDAYLVLTNDAPVTSLLAILLNLSSTTEKSKS